MSWEQPSAFEIQLASSEAFVLKILVLESLTFFRSLSHSKNAFCLGRSDLIDAPP